MFPADQLHALLTDVCDCGVVVALSGGVDSTLLLSCLAEFRDRHPYPLTAVTVRTPMTMPHDIRDARVFAESLHVPWQELTVNPLTLPAVKMNRPDRCYHCKKMLFTGIKQLAAAAKIKTVMDGTNASDSPKERPGMKALSELEILSPFVQCGITKEMIRAEAFRRKLPAADKPANACLATRFPPETELTSPLLKRVAVAEDSIRREFPKDADLRLRCWGNVAVLETDPVHFPLFELNRERWGLQLGTFGFRELLLHPDGLRSGRMTPPPTLKDYQ